MKRKFTVIPGKGITASTERNHDINDSAKVYSEKEIVESIKRYVRIIDGSCVVKNGGIQISSHERDMYSFAYLNDVVSYVNENIDNPKKFHITWEVPENILDDIDWDSLVGELGETISIHHAFERSEFIKSLAKLREKYLGIVKHVDEYPEVTSKIDELFELLSDMGEENMCPITYDRDYLDAKRWLKWGQIQVRPKLDEVTITGRYNGLFSLLYSQHKEMADQYSKKMLKVVRSRLDEIRSDLDLPSLEVGRSITFNLSDVR